MSLEWSLCWLAFLGVLANGGVFYVRKLRAERNAERHLRQLRDQQIHTLNEEIREHKAAVAELRQAVVRRSVDASSSAAELLNCEESLRSSEQKLREAYAEIEMVRRDNEAMSKEAERITEQLAACQELLDRRVVTIGQQLAREKRVEGFLKQLHMNTGALLSDHTRG